MSERASIPASDTKIEQVQSTVPLASHRKPSSSHWSVHRQQDVWLLLLVVLLGGVMIFALSNGILQPGGQALRGPSDTVSAPVTKQPSTSTSAITATGTFHEYALPQSDSQIMRLAIDHTGRLWFGEMGKNFLAVFDPQTQTFQQMIPPHGQYGMMGVQVAPDNTIWFAEQYANYIGHYFPATGTYQLYPLPRLSIPDPGHAGKRLSLPSAPNELALDQQGQVWFTEFNGDSLGRLDPRTGRMRHYPLAATSSVQTLYPYGVTVDPQGMVWFTESSNDQIGRLDPATGTIHFFKLPGPNISLMEIASDSQGTIWATSFSSGVLLHLDPRTSTFTSYTAPFTGKGTSGLYGLTVTPTNEVWVTVLAENVIARLDRAAHQFIYYHLPTPDREPLSVVIGPHQTLWFVEVDKIGRLQV